MTAKEKALQLVDKYADKAAERTDFDYDIQCALICVDEILKNITEEVLTYKPFVVNTDYWQEVKQEINKL